MGAPPCSSMFRKSLAPLGRRVVRSCERARPSRCCRVREFWRRARLPPWRCRRRSLAASPLCRCSSRRARSSRWLSPCRSGSVFVPRPRCRRLKADPPPRSPSRRRRRRGASLAWQRGWARSPCPRTSCASGGGEVRGVRGRSVRDVPHLSPSCLSWPLPGFFSGENSERRLLALEVFVVARKALLARSAWAHAGC